MTTTILPPHMRIAALQCGFESGEEGCLRIPEFWSGFGFNVEQLFHTHCELYAANFSPEKHGPHLQRYLARARDHGLAVILYLNTHILLESQRCRAAEWAERDRDGQYRLSYGTYYSPCLNSPWATQFLELIASLRDYDLAGMFFDGPSQGRCFCPHCDALFRADHSRGVAEAAEPEISAFAAETRLRFIRACYHQVRAVNPAWVSYINTGIMHAGTGATGLADLLACNDIIGTEGGFQFYAPPGDVDIWRCGQHARLVDAVAGEKPGVIFFAGDHKPWSWYLHTPAETKLFYMSALANGCSVWYGIHCNTATLVDPVAGAVRDVVGFDQRHDALYQRTASLADVAVFYSFDTAHRYTTSGEQTDLYASDDRRSAQAIGDYNQSFQGAYGALFRSGLAFDVVTELNLADLDRYRVVLLPTAACLDNPALDALRDFVRRGGCLIADSETSLFDAQGRRRPDFQLADLFGVSWRGARQYHDFDYFAVEDPAAWPGLDLPAYLPAPLTAVDVHPAESAEVLARLYPPLAGRYAGQPVTPEFPFIIRNRHGQGAAIYLAGTFFELYLRYGITHYRSLIQHLVAAHSRPVAELLGAPESVEFTLCRSAADGTVLAHLVNYTGGMTRPIPRVVPLLGLQLQLNQPFASARTLLSGQDLTITAEGRIELPVVHEFEVVALTP